MAHTEGARRIKRLGFWVALLGVLIAFPLWVVDLQLNKVGYGDVFVMISLPIILGGVIYVAGWIVEGFLAPRY